MSTPKINGSSNLKYFVYFFCGQSDDIDDFSTVMVQSLIQDPKLTYPLFSKTDTDPFGIAPFYELLH